MFIIFSIEDEVSYIAARILKAYHKDSKFCRDGVNLVEVKELMTSQTLAALVLSTLRHRPLFSTTTSPELFELLRVNGRRLDELHVKGPAACDSLREHAGIVLDMTMLFDGRKRQIVENYTDGLVITFEEGVKVSLSDSQKASVSSELGIVFQKVKHV